MALRRQRRGSWTRHVGHPRHGRHWRYFDQSAWFYRPIPNDKKMHQQKEDKKKISTCDKHCILASWRWAAHAGWAVQVANLDALFSAAWSPCYIHHRIHVAMYFMYVHAMQARRNDLLRKTKTKSRLQGLHASTNWLHFAAAMQRTHASHAAKSIKVGKRTKKWTL